MNALKRNVARLVLAGMIAPLSSIAADQSWFAAGPTNNWNLTDLNWDAGAAAWVNGNNAVFNDPGEAITLTAGITAGNLTFGAAGYSLSGASALTLTGSTVDTGANSASIGTQIAAAGSFSKAGSGTLVLNRAAGSGTALAGVTVGNGVLDLAGTAVGFNTGYFTGTTPITVNAGGTLAVKQLWNIASTNVVTINGGILNFNGTTTDGTNYVNTLSLQNGASVTGAGGYRIGNVVGTVTLPSTGDLTNTIATNIYLVKAGAGTTYDFNVANGASDVDLEITGRIFDLGQNGSTPSLGGTVVRKSGAGTLRSTGASSYVGGTVLSQGTLLAAANAAFSTGAITIGDAASGTSPLTLTLQQRADISNPITISALATGPIVVGADNTGSGSNPASLLGVITANRAFTLRGSVSADRLAVDGRVTGTPGLITVDGGSRTTFASTANDFVGDILVTGLGSILQASVAGATEVIPNAASITLDPGTVFQLASLTGAETINALNGSGTVRTFIGGSFGSGLTVGAAGGSGQFDGAMVNGTAGNPLSFTKVGAGTQTLTGFSTYTGPTIVEAGILKLDLGGALSGTSSITVKNGATLDVAGVSGGFILGSTQTLQGAGSVTGPVTLDGFLSPGEPTGLQAGALTFNNAVTLGAFSTSTFQIGGAFASDYDRITGITDFTLDGTVNVSFINSYNPVGGESFDLINWSGAFVDGFDVASDLILPPLDLGLSWDTSGFESAGVITVVPEPSALVMLLGGLGLLSLGRRRR